MHHIGESSLTIMAFVPKLDTIIMEVTTAKHVNNYLLWAQATSSSAARKNLKFVWSSISLSLSLNNMDELQHDFPTAMASFT